ncbi:MAG: condensation domain-containing protein, partial [Bacteroidota bacterium]
MKELIQELQAQNISIAVVDNELEVSFDGDTIDPALVEKIRSNKQGLIDLLKKHNVQGSSKAITPAPEAENYVLSNAQRRLWVVSQVGDNTTAYNLPNQVLLNDLDAELFATAICTVVARHEILRTVFR